MALIQSTLTRVWDNKTIYSKGLRQYQVVLEKVSAGRFLFPTKSAFPPSLAVTWTPPSLRCTWMYKCRQKQDAESGQGRIHGVFRKRYLIRSGFLNPNSGYFTG